MASPRTIPTNPEKCDVQEGRWRVTTSAYRYEFRASDNARPWVVLSSSSRRIDGLAVAVSCNGDPRPASEISQSLLEWT